MKTTKYKTRDYSYLNIVIIFLSVLIVLSLSGLAAYYVYLHLPTQTQEIAAVINNKISKEDSESKFTIDDSSNETDYHIVDKEYDSSLELSIGKHGEKYRFEVNNMLPGDIVTRRFYITVNHDIDLELFFKTEIIDLNKNLDEVLYIKVVHLETGNVLCDAPISKVNGREISLSLKKNTEKKTVASYLIKMYLDTSVGNEYQGATLKTDFKWYIKEENSDGHFQGEQGLIPPNTGAISETFFCMIVVIVLIVLLLLLLFGNHRKREKQDE